MASRRAGSPARATGGKTHAPLKPTLEGEFPRDQTARKRPARVFPDDRRCAKWRAVARRLPRAISFAGRTSKQSGARRKRRSMPARTRRFCRARKKHESFVSHSRVPGADKAQARHEPLISSLERGRRNCDVLAKRSHLVFFGSRLIRTRGFSANRVACSARNSQDAPIGDPTGTTPARRSETRTHTPEVWSVPNFLPSVSSLYRLRTGRWLRHRHPLPQSSPRVAYAREGRSRVQGTRIRTLPSRADEQAPARREHSPRAKSVRERRDTSFGFDG